MLISVDVTKEAEQLKQIIDSEHLSYNDVGKAVGVTGTTINKVMRQKVCSHIVHKLLKQFIYDWGHRSITGEKAQPSQIIPEELKQDKLIQELKIFQHYHRLRTLAIANVLGCTTSAISRWYRGEHCSPRFAERIVKFMATYTELADVPKDMPMQTPTQYEQTVFSDTQIPEPPKNTIIIAGVTYDKTNITQEIAEVQKLLTQFAMAKASILLDIDNAQNHYKQLCRIQSLLEEV